MSHVMEKLLLFKSFAHHHLPTSNQHTVYNVLQFHWNSDYTHGGKMNEGSRRRQLKPEAAPFQQKSNNQKQPTFIFDEVGFFSFQQIFFHHGYDKVPIDPEFGILLLKKRFSL